MVGVMSNKSESVLPNHKMRYCQRISMSYKYIPANFNHPANTPLDLVPKIQNELSLSLKPIAVQNSSVIKQNFGLIVNLKIIIDNLIRKIDMNIIPLYKTKRFLHIHKKHATFLK